MLEQAGRLGRDAPLALRELPPPVHLLADIVDDGGRVVLLIPGREVRDGIEREALLGRLALPLLGLGNGRDELGGTAALKRALGRLTGLVQFPVCDRVFVRGV